MTPSLAPPGADWPCPASLGTRDGAPGRPHRDTSPLRRGAGDISAEPCLIAFASLFSSALLSRQRRPSIAFDLGGNCGVVLDELLRRVDGLVGLVPADSPSSACPRRRATRPRASSDRLRPSRPSTRYVIFFSCRLVLGGDVDDAIGVDVEGDIDLRHAAGAAECPSAGSGRACGCRAPAALALQDVDFNAGLAVGAVETSRSSRRDRRVPRDERRQDAAERFDPSERRHSAAAGPSRRRRGRQPARPH